jgi:hypothetical protein
VQTCAFTIASDYILLKMRSTSDKAVEKTKIHFMLNIFLFENWAFCEIIWGKMLHADRALKNTMRFARWILKATDTHSEYVILLLHSKHGYAKAPHCYVICILPAFYVVAVNCQV